MKKVLFLFLGIICHIIVMAQGVAIGTNTPEASAILHLNSTTKGLLIPSMTSIQRISIDNPAEGLMVYDLTNKRIFVHRNGDWQFFIDNSFWAQSTTRNWVYNSSDSVGIGNAAPSERLHVTGNIRSTGDLKLSGNAGIGLTTPEQSLHIRSSSASEGIILEAENPILQLRQSNSPSPGYTNKGFVQLSGDNIRIGTNSSNSNGNFVIRTGGEDRIVVNSDGDMNIATKITSDATGSVPLTPLCYGLTATLNGGIQRGTTNVNVVKTATGRYKLTCPGLTANSVVILSPLGANVLLSPAYIGPGEFEIIVYSFNTSGFTSVDQVFYFIIY